MRKIVLFLLVITIFFYGCKIGDASKEIKKIEADTREFVELAVDEKINVLSEVVDHLEGILLESKKTDIYKNNDGYQSAMIDEGLEYFKSIKKAPKKLLEEFIGAVKGKTVQDIIDETMLMGTEHDYRKWSELGKEDLNKIYNAIINRAKYDLDKLEKFERAVKEELLNSKYKDMKVFEALPIISETIENIILD